MSKAGKAAARKRKRASKRARRLATRAKSQAGIEADDDPFLGLLEEALQFDEPDAAETCSAELAEHFAEASSEAAAVLAMHAKDALRAVAEWPDDERVRSLRATLGQFALAAERDAVRWQALADRFDSLAEDAAAHHHLQDGRIVAPIPNQAQADEDENPF